MPNRYDRDALVTARLVLRPLRPGDADEMAEVLGDSRLHEFIGGHPLTLEDLRSRYRRLAKRRSDDGAEEWLNWIIRLRATDAAVGTVQATLRERPDGWTAQVAWVVGVPWQRQGIAAEAAVALVRWLDRRGVREVWASIDPRHIASQAVASRAGLVPTDDFIDEEQRWRRSVALGASSGA